MAASMKKSKQKSKKPLSKDDLRRLMKVHRTEITKKVEHPCAKYNSLDQLICIVCNSQVKNEKLWNAHLMGRTHKENVAELKRQKEQPTPESRPSHKRRVSDDGNDAVTKKTKQNAETTEKAGGIVSLGSYDSSDNDDDNENEKDKEDESSPANSNQLKNQLPPDFFDKDVQPGSSAEQAVGDELLTKSASMADALPEGFFDNPVEDAKVRQVEYKDKMDDEWELFQKAMKEEKLVSEAIIEDEEEHITEERNIEEIDDQMRRWSKVHALAQKKEQIMQEHNLNSAKGSESDSDIDEQAFDEFLDWRSKSAWKS
ncbi:zinc finger protein 830-like isoform X3 [Tubulanus polymorphus]|uniref:zinc finger protein 830-like n=1 Tax=Tubulanus polymorphus TaxID=672921 RepID=UPI003DA4D05D